MASEPKAASDEAAEQPEVFPKDMCSRAASEENECSEQSIADCVLPEQKPQHLRKDRRQNEKQPNPNCKREQHAFPKCQQ
jgi:hypothetical protein